MYLTTKVIFIINDVVTIRMELAKVIAAVWMLYIKFYGHSCSTEVLCTILVGFKASYNCF